MIIIIIIISSGFKALLFCFIERAEIVVGSIGFHRGRLPSRYSFKIPNSVPIHYIGPPGPPNSDLMAAARWADLMSESAEDEEGLEDVMGPWANFAPMSAESQSLLEGPAVGSSRRNRRQRAKNRKTSKTKHLLPSEVDAPQNEQAAAEDFLCSLLVSAAGGTTNRAEPHLDTEVYEYVCAIMHPDAHLSWGKLSLWQSDLQARCDGYDLACPFWHAVVYELDVALHLEVEAFVRMVLAEAWSLELLHAWQRRLKKRTRSMWFPRRLWYDLVHRTNLTGGTVRVRLSLANMMVNRPQEQN